MSAAPRIPAPLELATPSAPARTRTSTAPSATDGRSRSSIAAVPYSRQTIAFIPATSSTNGTG